MRHINILLIFLVFVACNNTRPKILKKITDPENPDIEIMQYKTSSDTFKVEHAYKSSGNIIASYLVYDNELNGQFKTFDTTGHLKSLENFKDGKLHGKNLYHLDSLSRVTKYYNHGSLEIENQYHKGKIISSNKYKNNLPYVTFLFDTTLQKSDTSTISQVLVHPKYSKIDSVYAIGDTLSFFIECKTGDDQFDSLIWCKTELFADQDRVFATNDNIQNIRKEYKLPLTKKGKYKLRLNVVCLFSNKPKEALFTALKVFDFVVRTKSEMEAIKSASNISLEIQQQKNPFYEEDSFPVNHIGIAEIGTAIRDIESGIRKVDTLKSLVKNKSDNVID